MSRVWLVISGLAFYWIINDQLPNVNFIQENKRGIPILLYERPMLNSTTRTYFIYSNEIESDYEYCDFYRVILRLENGMTLKRNLYKKANELKEYNLKIIPNDSFQKKDCNKKFKKKKQKVQTVVDDYLDFLKSGPRRMPVAPPPPPGVEIKKRESRFHDQIINIKK